MPLIPLIPLYPYTPIPLYPYTPIPQRAALEALETTEDEPGKDCRGLLDEGALEAQYWFLKLRIC
jgi:hypothetical protein